MNTEPEYKAVLREARSMARVRHPNIVSVHGIDRHDNRVGFWSDFVHGSTLSAWLAAQGVSGSGEAALIGVEVCKALSAVHAAGLLHRDIKASNVMRETGGRIVLMDFGLSHELKADTHQGGTPQYMAPELLEGGPPSVATDLYATGVLVYHLVTGKFPVQSYTTDGMRRAHATGERRRLIDERPDLPEAFARTVETVIHPDPGKRFPTAGALMASFSETVGSLAAQSGMSPSPAKRKRLGLRAGLLAMSVAIASAAAWIVLDYSRHPSRAIGPHASVQDAYIKTGDLLLRYDKPENIDRAIMELNGIVAQDPRFALAYADLARANFLKYRKQLDPALLERARTNAARAMELDSALAPPHVVVALIENLQGHSALAMQELNRALALDSASAEIYAAQASVFAAQKREKDVEQSLEKAVDLAPDDWRWPNQLGVYYNQAGKFDEATRAFEKVTRLTPDNAQAWSNLGAMYLKQNRFGDSEKALMRSVQIQPAYTAYSSLGALYAAQGRFADSAEMQRKAVEMSPTNYLTWGNLAGAYLWSPGGREKALETYRKPVALAEESRRQNPNDARLLANLGGYYAALGDSDRSVKMLRQAVTLEPGSAEMVFRLGEAYEILGQREAALQWIGKALRLGYSTDHVTRSPELAQFRADPRYVRIAPI